MKTEASIEIDRPIEQVFELTNGNVAKWSTVVTEEVVIEDRNNGDVGTKFRLVTEERGKQMVFDGEVTEHRPPRSSRSRLTGKYFDIDAHYLFEDLRNGRTRVTQQAEVTGKGLVKVMMFFMGLFMKKSGNESAQKEMRSLKAFVESS